MRPHFTGLEQLVAENPNYHVDPRGKVYSDELSLGDLKRIRGLVTRRFYGLRQMFRFLDKCVRNGALPQVPGFALRLPTILGRSVLYGLHQAWRRRRLRRRQLYQVRSHEDALAARP